MCLDAAEPIHTVHTRIRLLPRELTSPSKLKPPARGFARRKAEREHAQVCVSGLLTDFSEPADELVRAFPAEWRFWVHRPVVHEGVAYPGGLTDSHHMVETPFLDVCNHDPMLTLVGALPPAFGLFLRGLGHPASSLTYTHTRARSPSSRAGSCRWTASAAARCSWR